MALSELLHPGFQSLLAFLHILLGLTASWHALLTKRDPRAAMGWIGTCLLFPFGGTLLYFFFGINRIAASARRTRERVGLTENAIFHPSANGAIPAEGEAVLPRLMRIGTKVTGLPLQSGNEITMLRTGEDAYGVATPDGWQLGDKVIVPPPQTSQDAEERMGEGYECADWYFCKKSL